MTDADAFTFPELGMGGAHLGNMFARADEAQSFATLNAAWEAGVRYYDTAPWYGNGLSELRVGALLRDKPRADFAISTKVGRRYNPLVHRGTDTGPWMGPHAFELTYDYTAAGFEQSLIQSRLRLGFGEIDALIIHDLDKGYHGDAFDGYAGQLFDSGMAYLRGLRDQGEIKLIGMGVNATDDFAFFVDKVDVDFFLVAMPYTLLDQSALDGPMRLCVDRGIRIVIGAPFASGLLADHTNTKATYGYATAGDDKRRKAAAIAEICARHDVPLAAAALAFPMMHPSVMSVIPGAVSPEQVTQNVANAKREIPAALWRELQAEGLIHPNAPISS